MREFLVERWVAGGRKFMNLLGKNDLFAGGRDFTSLLGIPKRRTTIGEEMGKNNLLD